MSWNQERYESMKTQCKGDISNKRKSAQDYMMLFKKMIVAEDYEAAKAITEVLHPLGYYTHDTHQHIEGLCWFKEQKTK